MKRGIIYRGKRCSDGKWVYGFYVESKYSWQGHKPHKSWIVPNAISNGGFFNVLGRYAVKDDTVGQFTCLYDKNGKEIYEGDILELVVANVVDKSVSKPKIRKVIWKDCGFEIVDKYNSCICDKVVSSDVLEYTVVGNIYDNPELLSTK